MEKREKKYRRRYSGANDHVPDVTQTASTNECTGLMPTPPQGYGEFASYGQLFSMQIDSDDIDE